MIVALCRSNTQITRSDRETALKWRQKSRKLWISWEINTSRFRSFPFTVKNTFMVSTSTTFGRYTNLMLRWGFTFYSQNALVSIIESLVKISLDLKNLNREKLFQLVIWCEHGYWKIHCFIEIFKLKAFKFSIPHGFIIIGHWPSKFFLTWKIVICNI